MAIQINPQGFVDAIVNDMQKTKLDHKAEKMVISKFDDVIDTTVQRINEQISDFQSQIDKLSRKPVENAKHIARLNTRIEKLEARVDYYMS